MNFKKFVRISKKIDLEVDEDYDDIMLGQGCDRTVFQLSDRYVIKIAHYREESANEREYDRYNDHRSKLLAKCYWISKNGKYLIQEYIENNKTDHYNIDLDDTIRCELYEETGLDLRDLHRDNVGMRDDGSLIVFDYGE